MGFKLHLQLNRVVYNPGETVVASVQAANIRAGADGSSAIFIRDLTFCCAGSERTDPNWISELHLPEFRAEDTQARRVVRTIFKTEICSLLTQTELPAQSARCFLLKFRLPSVLPPTFKGSSIRYAYSIDVSAMYEELEGMSPTVYETTATAALLVWPLPAALLPRPVCGTPKPSTSRGATATLAAAPYLPVPSQRATAQLSPSPSSKVTGNMPPDAAQTVPATTGEVLLDPVIDYMLGQTDLKVQCKEIPAQGTPRAGRGLNVFGTPAGRFGHMCSGFASNTGSTSHLSMALPTTPTASPLQLSPYIKPNLTPTAPPTVGPSPSPELLDLWRNATCARAGISPDPDAPASEPASQTLRLPISSQGSSYCLDSRPCTSSVAVATVQRRMQELFGKSYVLQTGDYPVMSITLQAPVDMSLQPGATIGGLLDLEPAPRGWVRPGVPRCHKVVVMLESEEVVSASACHGRVVGDKRATFGSNVGEVIRRLHCEHQEVTTDLATTQFTLSIPAGATPTFRTPMISLRWALRFELYVGPADLVAEPTTYANLQRLAWILPLPVRAPVLG